MSERVIENPRDVIELSKYFTGAELARHFHVSRQRIHQILTKAGVKARRFNRNQRRLLQSGIVGKMTDADVAVALDISVTTVRNFRQSYHIPRFRKKIGCPRCKTHEYAKGMCRNCYTRERRNRGLKY